MIYQQLSDEAKDTLKGMVHFCINNGYCMGMDEGIDVFAEDDVEEVKHSFRTELEAFCAHDDGKGDDLDALISNFMAISGIKSTLSAKISNILLPQADKLIAKGDIGGVIAIINKLPPCPTRMLLAGKVALARNK